MEVILSERRKELILYKNYKFSCKNLTKNGRKWRCTEKTCNAKLYVNEVKTTILKEETEHNHLPYKNVQRQLISNQLTNKYLLKNQQMISKLKTYQIYDKIYIEQEENLYQNSVSR
ncbi:unnamed protein product [Macrosiphum euphorbiae]|uniref:FLYWCH-type domain-containing protein n=1 Tax=Macrosiphum euphorbiae TaxID=13131 RepID=A0AAV0WI24_9HEMI|nr:unnamed protein product [Macrosiphum euphorbiae]